MGAQLSNLIEDCQKSDGLELSLSSVGRVKEKELTAHINVISERLPLLRAIDARDLKLKSIPSSIKYLNNLRVIDLTHNRVSEISEDTLSPKLIELQLGSNRFSRIPRTIVECVRLEHLDFSQNSLTAVEHLSALKQLKGLFLEENSITELSHHVTDIPSLTTLNLASNKLVRVSESIGSLTNLVSLNLSKNNLSSLPDTISACVLLKELDISNNDIDKLPLSVANLTQLTTLLAQHNKLPSLPKDIGKLCKLRILKLHGNRLTRLPESIGQLTVLSELCIQENKLKRIPKEIGGCVALRKFYAEFNEIHDVPIEISALKNLIVLIIHHNNLSAVPEGLGELKQLLRLSLDDNPLPQGVLRSIEEHGALGHVQRGGHADELAPIPTRGKPSSAASVASSTRIKASRAGRFGTISARVSHSQRVSTLNSDGDGDAPKKDLLHRNISMMIRPEEHKVDVPEDEMKRFIAKKRGATIQRSRSPTPFDGSHSATSQRSKRTEGRRSSVEPSLLLAGKRRTHSDAGVIPARESNKPSVPSYSKFKDTFENFVESNDFSAERKSEMKKMDARKKWHLLGQYKGSTLDIIADNNLQPAGGGRKGSKRATSAQEYVQALQDRPTLKCFDEVVVCLETQGDGWTARFVEAGGVDALLQVLRGCCKKRRVSRRDRNLAVRGLRCLRCILEVSLRTVLTTTDAVNTVMATLKMDDADVSEVLMDVLSFIIQIHYVGPHMVMEGLRYFTEHVADGDASQGPKRLMAPLRRVATPYEVMVDTMQVINGVIGEEEDLEQRLERRKSFVKEGLLGIIEGARAMDNQMLLMQLDRFEDDLEHDYEETLLRFEKSKLLERLEAGDDGVEGDCLRVLVSLSGRSMVIPLEESTMVAAAADVVAAAHVPPLALPAGLYHDGDWLVGEATFGELGLLGKGCITAELRLKHVEFSVSAQGAEDALELMVDPQAPSGDVVHQIRHALGVAQEDEAGEDWGLVVDYQDGRVRWVEELDRLAAYAPFTPSTSLCVKRRPISIRVRLAHTHTHAEFAFDPSTTVGKALTNILERLNAGVGGDDFGLYVQYTSHWKKKHRKGGVWLSSTRTLQQFDFDQAKHVWVKRKPRKVWVSLAHSRSKPRGMRVDMRLSVHDLIKYLCHKLHVHSHRKYSLYLREDSKRLMLDGVGDGGDGDDDGDVSIESTSSMESMGGGDEESAGDGAENKGKADGDADVGVQLNPHTSLWDQSVAEGADLVLGPYRKYVATQWEGSVWAPGVMTDQGRCGEDGALEVASLARVVVAITPHTEEDADPALVEAVLMGYRAFCAPERLLAKFTERLDVPDGAGLGKKEVRTLQLRVCTRVQRWITLHHGELVASGYLQFPLERFLRMVEEQGYEASGVVAAMKNPPIMISGAQPGDEGAPPRGGGGKKHSKVKNFGDEVSVFDIDETELARQLTLSTWNVYRGIKSNEFFGFWWTKPEGKEKCAGLLGMIEEFNRTAAWVSTVLVSCATLRERKKLMERMVKVAQALLALNNFHLVMAIVSGLNNSATLRLKWTRHKLPKRTKTAMAELEALMNMEGSYRAYRKRLAHTEAPCLPYVGVCLTDLTFIEEGNPDTVEGMCNVAKLRLVHNIVAMVARYQKESHDIQPNPQIQAFLAKRTTLSEKELFDESLKREPRGAKLGEIA